MTIQWFPGHMAKAKREVEQKLKLVDLVIELVDARAPRSSENPMLQQVIQNKPRLVVLMKSDLADPQATAKWLQVYDTINQSAIAINSNNKEDIQTIIHRVREIGQEKMDKLKKKGIRPRPIRAMIVGIPNVGKSTLINRLANKRIAKIGDRPGITKQQSWIKVKNSFELLDTPGILWPKFEDQMVGVRLAAIGTIKDQLVSLQDIAVFVIQYLQSHYPEHIYKRYQISSSETEILAIFTTIGKKRGALESGGHVNMDKVAEIIIQDLRSGKLGRITLE